MEQNQGITDDNLQRKHGFNDETMIRMCFKVSHKSAN